MEGRKKKTQKNRCCEGRWGIPFKDFSENISTRTTVPLQCSPLRPFFSSPQQTVIFTIQDPRKSPKQAPPPLLPPLHPSWPTQSEANPPRVGPSSPPPPPKKKIKFQINKLAVLAAIAHKAAAAPQLVVSPHVAMSDYTHYLETASDPTPTYEPIMFTARGLSPYPTDSPTESTWVTSITPTSEPVFTSDPPRQMA